MDPAILLKDLAIVLVAAALATILCQRIGFPAVLGYLIAGLVAGPHLPLRLIADEGVVRAFSELGVTLLMFSLGLDFNLRRIIRLGPTAGLTTAIEVGLMMVLGYLTGQALGWSHVASIFAAGSVAISSTMIVAKILEDRQVDPAVRDLVFGVLVFEDLVAVVLIGVLTAIGTGAKVSPAELGVTIGRLALVIVGFLVGGMVVIPRLVRAVAGLHRREILLVTSVGIALACGTLMHVAGYSVALGGFLAGLLVAESGLARMVEEEIRSVRDVFAAIFFVAVGMQLDPAAVGSQWPVILAFLAVVIVGKMVGVTIGAFLTGHGTLTSVRTGLGLAQIGEFAFIIAALGVELGAAPRLLYLIAIAVSALSAFLSPWFVRYSEPIALWIDRRLPRPLQTVVSLYGSWLDLLRRSPRRETPWLRVRQAIRLLLIDALCLAGVVITTSIVHERFRGVDLAFAGVGMRALLVAVGIALSVPFAVGIAGVARRIGKELAAIAMPPAAPGKVDNALSPRRMLEVTVQIAIVLIVGGPLVALTLPFLPVFGGPAVLLLVLALLGFGFWRSASDLQGHVRAGAELVVSALAKQSAARPVGMDTVRQLLPGMGDLLPVRIEAGSPARGQTLAGLNLRGRTGATVVALTRGALRIPFPEARQRLEEGDLVALTGSAEAIEAAQELLAGPR